MNARIAILAAALCVVPFTASAEDDAKLTGIMAIAKITGACGIVREMAHFQTITKMEGGTEFATRFILTEQARRGMTSEEWIKECNEATEAYDNLWEAASEMEAEQATGQKT